jgi:hypothetical protein
MVTKILKERETPAGEGEYDTSRQPGWEVDYVTSRQPGLGRAGQAGDRPAAPAPDHTRPGPSCLGGYSTAPTRTSRGRCWGTSSGRLELPAGRHHYKFIVDGEQQI